MHLIRDESRQEVQAEEVVKAASRARASHLLCEPSFEIWLSLSPEDLR